MKDYPYAIIAFGKVLRANRKRLKLTQARLAELMDGTDLSVSLLEKGEQEPKFTTFLLVTDALEIPADVFVKQVLDKIQELQWDNFLEC